MNKSWLQNMYSPKLLIRMSVLLLFFSAYQAFALTDARDVKDIGFDEKLGAVVPGDIMLRDEDNEPVKIKDLLTPGKPVILNLAYFRCPRLCSITADGLIQVMNEQKALELGKDFKILTVSFDPKDTPESAGNKAVRYRERVLQGVSLKENWLFLTSDQEDIKKLTDAVGFKFKPDGEEFAHPSGVIVLTPEGKVSRYLEGIQYDPEDFRLALLEASEGKIGSSELINKVLLFCYGFDPIGKRYALKALYIVKAAGIITLLTLCGVLTFFWRRERKEHE
ncbi:MAG: SCO family protein [Thermodesulfobacteriota bacterium]